MSEVRGTMIGSGNHVDSQSLWGGGGTQKKGTLKPEETIFARTKEGSLKINGKRGKNRLSTIAFQCASGASQKGKRGSISGFMTGFGCKGKAAKRVRRTKNRSGLSACESPRVSERDPGGL